MIIDKCDIIYTNDEIDKEVTLPCPDILSNEFTCTQGDLVGSVCIFYICPEGYSDNSVNCSKEVNATQSGIVFDPGRFWTGSAFGSFVIVRDLSGLPVDINSIFPDFERSGEITFILNGLTYTATLAPVVTGDTQLNFVDGDDIFASLLPNSLFTYPMENRLYGQFPEVVIWNEHTYNKVITTVCPEGSSLSGTKCYEYVDKIQTQEAAQESQTVVKRKAISQNIIVKQGEVKSTISKAHANQLAKELYQTRLRDLQPLCEELPVYYNDRLTKTGKKACAVGTPCDVTVTVEANEFSGLTKEEANQLAKDELDRLFSLSAPCCIDETVVYLSEAKVFSFTKSCLSERLVLNMERGGNFTFRGIVIPSFTSNISQADANNKRDLWVNINKALFEDLILCPSACGDIVKTEIDVVLTINGVIWKIERFDSGSFIDDINEINSELITTSSYKIRYCSNIPVYSGIESDITDSSGVNIISVTEKTITYSYIVSSPTFRDGTYSTTISISANTNLPTKKFKYGRNNCC